MEIPASKTYHVNNSTVTLIFGDILDSDSDVIVISGSIGLPMHGGLPQYVRGKASDMVMIDAQKHPNAKLGDVISHFDYIPFFEWLATYSHEYGKKINLI